MDWGTIIISVIGAVVGGGGLAGVFVPLLNRKEKKRSLQLENMAKINDEWKRLADERGAKIDKLNDKIDSLYEDMSEYRRQLDDANTRAAVAEIMKCVRTGCTDREPPFGQGADIRCEVKPKPKQKRGKGNEDLEAGD